MRLCEMVARRLREDRILRAHHSAETSLQRLHDLHARPLACGTHATRHRNLRADPQLCSARIGRRDAEVRLLGVHASSFRISPADRPTGRQPAAALETSLGGRRPPARPVWRIERRTGRRHEGRIPREDSRESRGHAWQGSEKDRPAVRFERGAGFTPLQSYLRLNVLPFGAITQSSAPSTIQSLAREPS